MQLSYAWTKIAITEKKIMQYVMSTFFLFCTDAALPTYQMESFKMPVFEIDGTVRISRL